MAQTAEEGIEFKAGGKPRLVAYSDSDWAVSHSTTGFCAEIIAALHATAEVIYLRGLLAEMGHAQDGPTPLHVDNSGAVELSKERR
eukprot:890283-Pleurochrysis_carterae.AAC.1